MTIPKISTTVIASIIVTGAALNFLSAGGAGQTAQKIANYIINGFGKGA